MPGAEKETEGAESASQEQASQPPPVAPARPAAGNKRQPPKVAYYVAPGKATRVGVNVVGAFTPVKPSDFERGQEDLDYLISKGVVVRGEPAKK